MFSWLMAKFYDNIMADAEEKCLQQWRKTLLQDLSGDVLEIGCGTGANLPYYSSSVNHLTLLEPDQNMQNQLQHRLAKYSHPKTSLINYDGQNIPLGDNSQDAVVCTLVLCTVNNPQQTLTEIYRVLKPQGKLIFIEHVAATNNPVRLKWQKRLEPIWKIIGCGCHVTRPTEQFLLSNGFNIETITRESMRGVPGIVRPSIRGIAVK